MELVDDHRCEVRTVKVCNTFPRKDQLRQTREVVVRELLAFHPEFLDLNGVEVPIGLQTSQYLGVIDSLLLSALEHLVDLGALGVVDKPEMAM